MSDDHEFDCTACGRHVVRFVPLATNDDAAICFTCAWLKSVPPENREQLRRLLNHEVAR